LLGSLDERVAAVAPDNDHSDSQSALGAVPSTGHDVVKLVSASSWSNSVPAMILASTPGFFGPHRRSMPLALTSFTTSCPVDGTAPRAD
ncbi:MAG: hypothetical protein AAFZ18_24820, partial [Myxococcota bacterium]